MAQINHIFHLYKFWIFSNIIDITYVYVAIETYVQLPCFNYILYQCYEQYIFPVDGNDSDGIVVLDEDDNVGRGGRRRSIPKAKVIDDNEDNGNSVLVR